MKAGARGKSESSLEEYFNGTEVAYNLRQNAQVEIEKSSKTGQEKSLISSFACFLTAIAKVQFLEGRLGTGLCHHPDLRSSSNISLFPRILSLKMFGNTRATHIPSLLYQKLRWLYLRLIGSVLKYCKVLKYYGQSCLKILFLLSTLPMLIQISGKNAHSVQKNSVKKLPIRNGESFLESIFHLN